MAFSDLLVGVLQTKIDLQAWFGTNFKGGVASKLEERLNHNETITTNVFSPVWLYV